MKLILVLLAFFSVTAAHAEGVFLTPSVGVGYNSEQDTYYRIGLDLGYWWDENVYFGVGGYYAAGDHPDDDREIGGGPFIGYNIPVFSFFALQFREDVD